MVEVREGIHLEIKEDRDAQASKGKDRWRMPKLTPRRTPPEMHWTTYGSVIIGGLIWMSAWRATFGTSWAAWLVGTAFMSVALLSFLLIDLDYLA